MAHHMSLIVLFVLTTATASAQNTPTATPTTRLIPFSGSLTDAAGSAFAGAQAVTFSLFDEREGGTLLWTETQTIVAGDGGQFEARLGASTALPLEIFRSEQARWLEVAVNGRALPRVMLLAVPYALRAADAETLAGRPLSEFVLTDANGRRVRADGTTVDDPAVDGTGVPNQLAKWNGSTTLSSSIVSESFDNRIGILAPDPTGGGVVDSRFTIRHLDNNTAIGVLNTSNQRRFALNILADGGWTLYDGGANTWNAGIRQINGGVGIGSSDPIAKLEVIQRGSREAGFFAKTQADNFDALAGFHEGSGAGVRGQSTFGIGILGIGGSGPAGHFQGSVTVTGTLTKGGGAFQIDHPLDPANKYLLHSFVESPDMMNVYNGNTVLDANGEAWVTLPEWFEALNRDFRYQLTAIGAPGPNLHIASKISGNRFRIAGGAGGMEVSWQVTGIRQDAWANAHRIPVESDKPASDRGFYLHPKAFDLPASMLIPSLRVEPLEARMQKHK